MLRYINHIFFIWTHDEGQLKYLDKFHSNLKSMWKTSQDSVNFLGLNVNLKYGAIFTDLHIKSTDIHQFLHYKSYHSSHIRNPIPYDQAMRISRLCSSCSDFNAYIPNLKDWFLARDYTQEVVSDQIDKVVFDEHPTHKDTTEQVVSLVATYHPKLKYLCKLIKNLHLFSYSNSHGRSVFSPAPKVSYRSVRKIKDYIVRSKLDPIERTVESYRCANARCQGMHKYTSNWYFL